MAALSAILQLIDLATGESAFSSFANWGEVTDRNLAIIEKTVGEITSKSVTTLDVNLTDDEELALVISCSGVLTGNRAVTVSGRKGFWYVKNACTGAFTLTFKTDAGTGIVVNQGTTAICYSDGTNVLAVVGGLPSTSTDNAIWRANGTAGGFQGSGVIIDDSNNITGVADLTATNNYRMGSAGTQSRLRYTVSGVATRFALRDDTLAADVLSFDTTGAATFGFGLSATSFSGSGASLTALNATNLSSGTVASARVSGSYTGITGTGALNAGSITSGFGSINIGASTFTTTGAVSGGAGTFSGTVTANGALNVVGAATFNDPVAIVGSTLSVDGTATMAGINAGAISGTTGTFSSTLGVTGATTLSNILSVAGTATMAGINASGALRVADGTEASVEFGFTADPNTGFYRPTDDAIGWVTGAVERIRMTTASLTMSNNPDLGVSASGTNPGSSMAVDGQIVNYVVNDALWLAGRSNSGTLVQWRVAAVTVGVISESAGTVTYGAFCGAHWSQWFGGKPLYVWRGMVLETVDQMSAWTGERNDTLPMVKISDTPGSKRVYGVYSHPDSEAPDRDFHVASLGAYVIRIAKGEIVKNGDYLESAGNGCAKVQADDILRSSTIAKVTAAAVVETYPDGSYLVPCTLHCG